MTFRFEEKIKLHNKKIFFFKEWLSKNKAQNIYPNREVYSIYFDNKEFQTHQDSIEGVVPRKKIRLRTYNFISENVNKFMNPFRRPVAMTFFLFGTLLTIYLGIGACLPIDKSLTLGLF